MARKPVASVRTMDETQKAELYAKLDEWHKAKAKAALWTAKERELREEIFSTYFPDAEEGTNTLNLDFGKALKATRVISRTPVRAELEAILQLERQKLEKNPKYKSNILPLIDTVITYDPKVAVGEYKKLSADDQKLLADIITIKDGAPQLSIETPKT